MRAILSTAAERMPAPTLFPPKPGPMLLCCGGPNIYVEFIQQLGSCSQGPGCTCLESEIWSKLRLCPRKRCRLWPYFRSADAAEPVSNVGFDYFL